VKLLAPAVLVVVLAALVAGCGGGTSTTVIEKTVTEKVEVPAKGGGGSGEGAGGKETAAATEAGKSSEAEAQQPKRIVHLRHFRTPSGNIGCVLFGGGARCDIRKRDWAPLPRPASCSKEVDYGQGLQVPHRGQATFVCAGDTALEPGLASLSYGTASRVGGSECISRSDGVTCVNQTGHGFFISVQSYQVF
jgi:uncharacterized protein DUF6636